MDEMDKADLETLLAGLVTPGLEENCRSAIFALPRSAEMGSPVMAFKDAVGNALSYALSVGELLDIYSQAEIAADLTRHADALRVIQIIEDDLTTHIPDETKRAAAEAAIADIKAFQQRLRTSAHTLDKSKETELE